MSFSALPAVTDLQKRLMRAVLDHIRDQGLERGDSLNQLALAGKFGVSRSPMRAALRQLEQLGAVQFEGGVALVAEPKSVAEQPRDPIEDLVRAISRLRHSGEIGLEVTENELMRRCAASRGQVVAALRRMASLGMVARKAGFGWRFVPMESKEARHEGYRLRLLLEPAALLEPGFRVDPGWLRSLREQHLRFVEQPWRDELAVQLFETNAEFHLGLAEASQNRYFVQAIGQQIGLRRMRNYSWQVSEGRAERSTREHLAVLDALIEGDRNRASQAMAVHIGGTMIEYR